MRVLVACEESQRVCTAFRERGHEAYSCDIQEPSGGHPEWHILGDVLNVLNPNRFCGTIPFTTMDGNNHWIHGKWDLIIAHPPCTYLSYAGNRSFSIGSYGEKALKRWRSRIDAASFFMEIANADCEKICVENPVGFMNSTYRKPDQIIEPYQFGHPFMKKTCLWLKGLPPLVPTDIVENPVPHCKSLLVSAWERSRTSEKQKQNLPRHRPGNGGAVGVI